MLFGCILPQTYKDNLQHEVTMKHCIAFPIIVILLIVASLESIAASAVPVWPSHSYRRIVVGADPNNAGKMLAQIKEVKECVADTVVFTGQLWGDTWFPSKMASYASKLDVKDPVAEGTRMAHEMGMKAVVYIGAPSIQNALVNRLDWRQRKPNGEVVSDQPSCCLLSPFGDWVIEYLVEMATHAPIDGYWLDGYPQYALGCSCRYCAEAYKKETGLDLPTSASNESLEYRNYAIWFQAKCVQHAQRLEDALHKVSPNLAVEFNTVSGRFANTWRYQADQMCATIDSPSLEQFWQVDNQKDPLQPIFGINMLTASAESHPTEVFVPMFPHMVDCTTNMPEVEAMARIFTVLTNGSSPQLSYPAGDIGVEKRCMAAIKVREPYLTDAKRIRYCGIAASTLTDAMYGRDKAEASYWSEVKGWLRALTEAHIPLELLTDNQLDKGQFDGLKVIVLPSAACLSESARKHIADFTRGGGGLVATSVTSLADGNGNLSKEFGLSEVLGVSYKGIGSLEPLPRFIGILPQGKHPLAQGEWIDKALWRQWSPLGHTIGSVGLPGTYTQMQSLAGHDIAWKYADGTPAIVAGSFGKGRTAYIGPEVGAAYYHESYPYLRSMMTAAVDWAAPSVPSYQVTAPTTIQVTVFRQEIGKGKYRDVVHLLNDMSSFGRVSMPAGALPIRDEVIPVAGIRVQFSGQVRRVHLEPEGLTLKQHTLPNGGKEVVIPSLGLHSMVVFEGR